MNPSYAFCNAEQTILTYGEFRYKTIRNQYFGIDLPIHGINCKIVNLQYHQIANIHVPLAFSNKWVRLSDIHTENMYVNLISQKGSCDLTQSWLRYDPKTMCLFLLFNGKTPIDDTCCLRIGSRSIFGAIEHGVVDNNVIKKSNNSVLAITPNDLLMVKGTLWVQPNTSLQLLSYPKAPVCAFKDIVRFKEDYDMVPNGIINLYGKPYLIFEGDYVDDSVTEEVRPLRDCLFYVVVSNKALFIPETAVRQLTPWSFLIDYTVLNSQIVALGGGSFRIYGIHRKNLNATTPDIDKLYDEAFLTTTLAKLTKAERLKYYLSASVPSISMWTVANLLSNPLVRIIGTNNRLASPDIRFNNLNQYYNETDSRFKFELERDANSTSNKVTYKGNTSLGDSLGLVYNNGVKLNHKSVNPTGVSRFTPEETNIHNPSLEIIPNDPFIDFVAVAINGTIYENVPKQLPYKIYRVDRVDKTTEPSLTKRVGYCKRYVEVGLVDIATLDIEEGVLTFKPECVGAYLFTYQAGAEIYEYDLDALYQSYALIMFSTVSETIPRIDCETIVFLNGKELCEGVEYVKHTVSDEIGIYGVEIYLLGVNHVNAIDNKLEIVQLRNMKVYRAHGVAIDKYKGFAAHLPQPCTQIVIDGCSRRDMVDDIGNVNFTQDLCGALLSARCMVPVTRPDLMPPETIQELHKQIYEVHPTVPILAERVLNITLVSAYDQAMIEEAYRMYVDGTIYSIQTVDQIAAWKAKFEIYKKVDELIDPDMLPYIRDLDYNYSMVNSTSTQVLNHKHNIPIQVRNLLEGIPSESR